MDKSYTPGPWKAVSDAVTKEIDVFEVADISHFRVIYAGGGDGYDVAGDPYCDARLIAAAPDLLEALQELLAVAPAVAPAAKEIVGIEKRHRAAIDSARAAIRKATRSAT